MKAKVGIPIVILAVIGVIVYLIVMGKATMSGPEAIHTAPPSFIDPATGKPKGQMRGSSETTPNGPPRGPGPQSGAPAGGQ